MSLVAFTLVAVAAFTHAYWNLLAKQVPSGAPFVVLVSGCGVVLWAPAAVALAIFSDVRVGALACVLILGSALIHAAYSLFLQYGYRLGDFSLTYPLARGSAPLFSSAGAVLVLGERPSALALLGLALVAGGVLTLSRPRSGGRTGAERVNARPAIGVGLGIGVLIAAYTVWDAYAIQVALLPPLLFSWLESVIRTALLIVPGSHPRGEIRNVWRAHKARVLAVAALSPLSYVLVLMALQSSDVSQVAPLRESSVLIGVALGVRVLGEGQLRRRLLAASAIFTGIIALATG